MAHAQKPDFVFRRNERVHLTWYFSDRASWIDYKLITNLMHWLLFIHKILFPSTCFEPQVLIFRRIQFIYAAYGTVTLYESSRWPVGTQLEWVHLNRRGRQFSGLPAAEMCASAVIMLDTPCSEVVWRVLGTHSIRQFPLHFPSRVSPCAITFQLDSTLLVDYTNLVEMEMWWRISNRFPLWRK